LDDWAFPAGVHANKISGRALLGVCSVGWAAKVNVPSEKEALYQQEQDGRVQ
jgi:hypothetical protein